MSTSGPSHQKIKRAEEETSGVGSNNEGDAVPLLSHFDENDFLEFRVGAGKQLKMKLQEADMLLQLYEKELGVEKVRRFRAEVKVKLGSELVSSGTNGNNTSSSMMSSPSPQRPYKVLYYGIMVLSLPSPQNEGWSTPSKRRNIKQTKAKNDNRKKAAMPVAGTSMAAPVSMSRKLTMIDLFKFNDESEELKQGGVSSSMLVSSASSTGVEMHGRGGTGGRSQTSSTRRSNQARKLGDEVEKPEVNRSRKRHISNGNEVSASTGDPTALAGGMLKFSSANYTRLDRS